MQFVLSPLPLHLYFISRVSHCINSCGVFFFLPSADNYSSRLGFVTIACFLLATLSADNAPQILDRCRGICSGDAVRGIITALFSSLPPHPPRPPRRKKNKNRKQTNTFPSLAPSATTKSALCCVALRCVVLCGAAALQLAGANYDLRGVPGASLPPSATNRTHLVSSTFPPAPSHLLTISSSYDLFTFTLPCFTFSRSPAVGSAVDFQYNNFTLHVALVSVPTTRLCDLWCQGAYTALARSSYLSRQLWAAYDSEQSKHRCAAVPLRTRASTERSFQGWTTASGSFRLHHRTL